MTKVMGFVARVLINGTAEFDDIVKEAGRNTTMHKAELRMAFELCLDSVVDYMKQGYIVDLGPIGKLYPSCSSGWYENADDMKLTDVKPSLYYRAGDEVEGAIKSAKLIWAKAEDEEDEDNGEEGGTPSGGDDDDSQGGGDQTPTIPTLTISKTGTGTATVKVGGNAVSSGSQIGAGTEVAIEVTPASGQVPTATLNGTSVSLTNNEGTYTGSFEMPADNATLVINSGSNGSQPDDN